MTVKQRINATCSWLRRYAPIINYLVLMCYGIGFIYFHYDMKRSIAREASRQSTERLVLFEERDKMIVHLMTVRTEMVTEAMNELMRSAKRMEKISELLERAEKVRNEEIGLIRQILERLEVKTQ